MKNIRLEDVTSALRRIVFCKDCKYAVKPEGKKYWQCSNSNWYKQDEDFCSRGLKKDGEEG